MKSINLDIDNLLDRINQDYLKIEQKYKDSLTKKEVDSDLKIDIKNFLENCRSVLEYCAREIGNSISLSSGKTIYFPIVNKNGNRQNFEGSIGRNLPGLKDFNISLYDYLESIQPYNQSFEWLSDFSAIVNNYKHVSFTPQRRTETERIVSKHSSGSTVSWNPSAVHFGGPGVFINQAPVNPITQLPEASSDTTITREVWVDFKFNDGISALSLLNKLNSELPKIIDQTYSFM